MDLRIDPDRVTEEWRDRTGILVRAQTPDEMKRWVNADIIQLDVDSLNAWLRSRGGENDWAESVVRILLGHGQ